MKRTDATSTPRSTTNWILILLKKVDSLFQSLIDRNNRPDRLHSHRTSAIDHQSSILSLTMKVAYVTV